MNTNFNSLDAATQGLISGNSFTVSVQGLLSFVEIDVVTKPIIGGALSKRYRQLEKEREEDEKICKIKVTVQIEGKYYTEEKLCKAKTKPSISDIGIELLPDNKIGIKVKNIRI